MSEQTILVTGSSRGIGKAIAERLAETGLRLITDVNVQCSKGFDSNLNTKGYKCC